MGDDSDEQLEQRTEQQLSEAELEAVADAVASELDTGQYGNKVVMSRRQALGVASGALSLGALGVKGTDSVSAQTGPAGRQGTPEKPNDMFAWDLDVANEVVTDLDLGANELSSGSVNTDKASYGSDEIGVESLSEFQEALSQAPRVRIALYDDIDISSAAPLSIGSRVYLEGRGAERHSIINNSANPSFEWDDGDNFQAIDLTFEGDYSAPYHFKPAVYEASDIHFERCDFTGVTTADIFISGQYSVGIQSCRFAAFNNNGQNAILAQDDPDGGGNNSLRVFGNCRLSGYQDAIRLDSMGAAVVRDTTLDFNGTAINSPDGTNGVYQIEVSAVQMEENSTGINLGQVNGGSATLSSIRSYDNDKGIGIGANVRATITGLLHQEVDKTGTLSVATNNSAGPVTIRGYDVPDGSLSIGGDVDINNIESGAVTLSSGSTPAATIFGVTSREAIDFDVELSVSNPSTNVSANYAYYARPVWANSSSQWNIRIYWEEDPGSDLDVDYRINRNQ